MVDYTVHDCNGVNGQVVAMVTTARQHGYTNSVPHLKNCGRLESGLDVRTQLLISVAPIKPIIDFEIILQEMPNLLKRSISDPSLVCFQVRTFKIG